PVRENRTRRALQRSGRDGGPPEARPADPVGDQQCRRAGRRRRPARRQGRARRSRHLERPGRPLDGGRHALRLRRPRMDRLTGRPTRWLGLVSLLALTAAPVPALATGEFVAFGADAGGAPMVKVADARTGALRASFLAYAAGFAGGVRVAVGDVNGDGTD